MSTPCELKARNATVLCSVVFAFAVCTGVEAVSLGFFENDAWDSDYGTITDLPEGFGEGEFTFEIWILLDESYPVGPTDEGEAERRNWSSTDNEPYSAKSWWWEGNFLIDGHNNNIYKDGTFSLQFFGGGRVRWLFGDGWYAGPGGHWSVGPHPANSSPTLLDGWWHHIAAVRRFVEGGGSDLELWIDGILVATEWSPERTNMRFFWDEWSGFPPSQVGWFFGAEKQAAIGWLSQYEDFKGLIGEIRFFSRARSHIELQSDWAALVEPSADGLVGLFRLDDGDGFETCDELVSSRCMSLINMIPGFWDADEPPIGRLIFRDNFEIGDVNAW